MATAEQAAHALVTDVDVDVDAAHHNVMAVPARRPEELRRGVEGEERTADRGARRGDCGRHKVGRGARQEAGSC